LEVQKRERAIPRAIENEKEAFCRPLPSDYASRENYYKCIGQNANAIARKVAEELNAVSYYNILYFLTITQRDAFVYSQCLLEMRPVVDVLHERVLIGFEEKPLYVGT